MKFFRQGILAFAMLAGNLVNAQAIQSPYSNYGLGEFLFPGLSHNFSMGELGIGTPNPWHINLQNPALLTHNSLSTFQVGISGDFRQYETNVGNASDNSASLRFLAMCFPIVRSRWSTSVALLPLSSVKYNTYNTGSLDAGESSITQFQGDGGLSQLVWANGIRIYKTFSIGIKASYAFGSIDRNSRVQLLLDSLNSNYAISYGESTSYSDFLFSVSGAYRFNVGENRYINVGMIYDISKSIEGTQDQFFERQSLSGSTIQSQNLNQDVSVSVSLPDSYGLGVSYEILNKLKVGVDINRKNWKNVNEGSTTSFRNISNIAAGMEFTPDYKSVNAYFKRVSYRVGLSMKQLPYLVNDTEINDFGINFGASFPVSGLSSMDAGFKFGIRGTTENNLIRENYFQFIIGATINDRWFIKRRYD